MSRNVSGTYSLPAGNPVVPSTTITSTWANTTLTDIASALTDSLDRTGKGEMTAQLKVVAGSAGTPGIGFATDTDTGIYRVGANQLGIASGGAAAAFFTAAQMNLAGRLVMNLNGTFDLATNTEAMSIVLGDATLATATAVAAGNTMRTVGVYVPVELDGSSAIGLYQKFSAEGSGSGGTMYGGMFDFVITNGAASHTVYGLRLNLDLSGGGGNATGYGVDVSMTAANLAGYYGAAFRATTTDIGSPNNVNGFQMTGDNAGSRFAYGIRADGTVRFANYFIARTLQGASDGGGFLLQESNAGVDNFSVDVNGSLYASVGANQIANLITTLSGAPATSTGADANRAFRISNADAELAMGIYASTQGIWIQARDDANYATNLPLSLQPNGSKVVVGTANATNVANSQVLDVWSGSIRAQGSSLAVGGGVGAEIDYTGGRGRLFCYDRSGSAWAGLDVIGLTIQLQANGVLQATIDTSGINLASTKVLRVNATQVVTARQTGWTAATGTPTRTTFATSTVTTAQLAERVKALIDDLITHGLIGA